MKDRFQSFSHAVAITPSDSTQIIPPALALLVSAAGTGGIKVDTAGGETVTLATTGWTFPATLPLVVTRVYATGTGVTGIFGLS